MKRKTAVTTGAALVITAAMVWTSLSGGRALWAEPLPLKPVPAKKPVQTLDYPEFHKQIQPFFTKYCIECHSAKGDEPDIRFDLFTDQASLEKWEAMLEKSVPMLRGMKMPPKKKTQPTPAEREAAVAWLEAYTSGIDCTNPAVRTPGRVTLRRLNRVEYNNTLHDLLGTDLKPANTFPVDDAGYGFDNNGDVLSIAPILMEKYLAAAGMVLDNALLAPPVVPPPVMRWDALTLEGTVAKPDTNPGANPGRGVVNGRAFEYSGEIHADFNASADGEYVLRIRAYGKQKPTAQFSIDGRPAGRPLVVTGEQRNTAVYETDNLHITPGKHRVMLTFAGGATKAEYEAALARPAATQPAPVAAVPPARPAAGRAVATPSITGKPTLGVVFVEAEGPLEITPERMSESYRRIMIARPNLPTVTKVQAAEKIFRSFVPRAYRRPITSDEINRLMDMWAKFDARSASFEAGIDTTLQAVLVSPYFLYRYEKDPTPSDPGGVRTLDEYELASRLSYFLWSTMPDDDLFRLAGKGQLRANLDAQVKRMMNDPKSHALVENFAGQWLQLRMMETVTPDPAKYPNFDDALRQAMITETQMLFLSIMHEDRSVLDFIDADFTFLNERLAKHYGISGVSGDQFRRVQLASAERGGLLAQASILTITSYPGRTSPVLRGKWVLENLFDEVPPPPPADVPPLKEAGEIKGTLRQRMEQHRTNPACATCHEQMDAIGFGLENFDPIGAWRTEDGAARIDPAGSLAGGQKFSGPAELKQIIKSRQDDFCKALATKMLTYSLGRGLEKYDKCSVEDIVAKMKENGYKFSVLVNEIVRSEPFQKRAAKS